ESVGGRGRGCIASQSLLPGLEKVFRPAVIEVLDDPLAAAELGDAVLAAQAFQYNADLVFRREVSPRRATDLLHDFCRRFFLRHGFLFHLRSLEGYDEPEILPSSTHPICLMSADGGHHGHQNLWQRLFGAARLRFRLFWPHGQITPTAGWPK